MNTRMGKLAKLASTVSVQGDRTLNEVDKRLAEATNEMVRKYNLNQRKLGKELIDIVRLADLEQEPSKNLLGRLIWTTRQQGQDALRSEWGALGEAALLEVDPTRDPMVMTVAVSGIEPGDPLEPKLKELEVRYDYVAEKFRGRVSVPELLELLIGTGVGMKVFPSAGRATDKQGLVLLAEGRLEPATVAILGLPAPGTEEAAAGAATPAVAAAVPTGSASGRGLQRPGAGVKATTTIGS